MAHSGQTRTCCFRDAMPFKKLFRRGKTDGVSKTRAWLASLEPKSSTYDPRILPQVIDRNAQIHPNKVWCSWSKSSDPAHGFVDVTWSQHAHAVNRAAEWLESALGGDSQNKIIAFLSSSKRVSLILTPAAAKLGCSVLFLSPRNSLEGQISLIDKLEPTFIMSPESPLPQLKQIRDSRPHLGELIVPSAEYFHSGPEPRPRLFRKTFEELRLKPYFYVHSSGTTSLPKPVPITFGAFAGVVKELTHRYPEGTGMWQQYATGSERLMIGFPLFHLAALFPALSMAPLCGFQIVLPPEDVPMNGDLATKMCLTDKAPFSAFLPPAVIEEMQKDVKGYKALITQTQLIYGGAPLSRESGNSLSADGLRLVNVFASSETVTIPAVQPKAEDWGTFHFPKSTGVELDHVGEDNYELVLNRIKGPLCSPVFSNFPNLDRFRTNDLFIRHPDPKKTDLWINAGRADDVIALLNGEKFTPLALEAALQAHPQISTALVFGVQRTQAALLLEPIDLTVLESEDKRQAFIDKVWHDVERANKKIAAHGRILRSHIILIDPAKGVLRTPKGTIQRTKMYGLYMEEMDSLYGVSSDTSSEGTAVSDDEGDETSTSVLKSLICDVASVDPNNLGDDDNLFMSGFDSLHCRELVSRLRASGYGNVDTSLIYNNPTIHNLYAELYKSKVSRRRHSRGSKKGFKAMDVMTTVEHLTKDLPLSMPTTPNKAVLITGTSGGLGQHLLEVARQRYSHIFVFVRSPTDKEHQSIHGVTYLHADLTAPQMGLQRDDWLMLQRSVTHIVHNAWLVDFNHPMSRFTDMIVGVRGLIDFAVMARHSPRIWFASSIGAVMGLSSKDGTPVKEEIFSCGVSGVETSPASFGYAQSKRAAELLLARAGEVSGVRSSICRIGQIAGSSKEGKKGRDGKQLPSWQERDYIPTMLKSAKYLKAIPEDLGSMARLDWTPIDHVAQVIFELLEAGDKPDAQVTQIFHLTNPALTRPEWRDILPTVRQNLVGNDGKPEDIEVVASMEEWVRRLEKSAEGLVREEIEANNPGVKLLQFFKDAADGKKAVPELDTTKAQQASRTLRNEPAMNAAWMESWMKEWFEKS